MSQRVFVSYARMDDRKPPGDAAAQGFVSRLVAELNYEFSKMQLPRPEIWIDTSEITDGILFDEKIRDGIAGASILLPILSPNWLTREYCRKELELFREKWSSEDTGIFKRRVTVVHGVFTELIERPIYMQGQVGHRFFSFPTEVEKQNSEQFFYDRGQVQDTAYNAVVRRLARELWEKTRSVSAAGSVPPDVRDDSPLESAAMPIHVAPRERGGPPVYLAKPSLDLGLAYQRLAAELTRQGFEVRPAPDAQIPSDPSSTSVIDKALEGCVASVHILGNDAGFAVAGRETSVGLQLSRAARRVEDTKEAEAHDGTTRVFRRIVWAPKIMPAAEGTGRQVERDPLNVLQLIDRFLPNDKVDGGVIDDFATFLVQNLNAAKRQDELATRQPERISTNTLSYYIYHKDIDRSLAQGVARALQRPGVTFRFPGMKGDDDERDALHRRNMRDCDALVLCWGGASDTWAKSYSAELEDWQAFGRREQFKVRGLVVGPPDDDDKVGIDLWADSQLVVVALSVPDPVTPDAVRALHLGP